MCHLPGELHRIGERAQTAFTNSERACKSQGMTSDAEKELSRIKRELDAQERTWKASGQAGRLGRWQ